VREQGCERKSRATGQIAGSVVERGDAAGDVGNQRDEAGLIGELDLVTDGIGDRVDAFGLAVAIGVGLAKRLPSHSRPTPVPLPSPLFVPLCSSPRSLAATRS